MTRWFWIALGALILGALLWLRANAFRGKTERPPRSPLAQAVYDEDVEAVRDLLDQGADPDSAMEDAFKIQPDECMSAEISMSLFGGSTRLRPGMPVLSFAALQGSTEITKLLIERGADVNRRDCYEQTPLILAAWCGDLETTVTLLKHGADPNARDESGRTALMWAQIEGNEDVIAVLIAA